MSQAKPFQLRLTVTEERDVRRFVAEKGDSKNDFVRRAVRLFVRLEKETGKGAKLRLVRPNGERAIVELWFV